MGKPTARKQKVRQKGKKEVKNHKSSKRWELYKKGYKRFCPKCGPGIFLADMKDRYYCGKCHYCEYKKQ